MKFTANSRRISTIANFARKDYSTDLEEVIREAGDIVAPDFIERREGELQQK